MLTIAHKLEPTEETKAVGAVRPVRAFAGQSREAIADLHLQRTIGNHGVQRLLEEECEGCDDGPVTAAPSRSASKLSRTAVFAKSPERVQTTLTVSAPGDAYEREADREAEQVMRMPEPQLQRSCACGGGCSNCRDQGEEMDQGSGTSQIRRAEVGGGAGPAAPGIVTEVLRSPGQPLDGPTREFMEPRFGRDLSRVRVHTDARSAESAQAVSASAYTVGQDIVFRSGAYRPASAGGRRLLAHELAHVVQQDGPDFDDSRVFRFMSDEREEIGDLDQVVRSAIGIAEDTGWLGLMRWGRFTAAMGALGAIEVVEALTEAPSPSLATNPYPRYLYTCRCGLIDLRHFYQLMYIAVLLNKKTAVEKGIEHEETAELESEYAPEDITSNALGAEFGSQRSWVQRQPTFVSALRAFLKRCEPFVWLSSVITPAQRDCVVNYYALDLSGGSHRRETAGSDADPCNVCGGTSSFPFKVDVNSPFENDRPRPCVSVTARVTGEKFLFEVNSDDFRPGEVKRLIRFGRGIQPNDVIDIHGLASEDGLADFNDTLSCARAWRAADILTSIDVDGSQIRNIFNHGATAGAREEMRSVVIDKETGP